jgi:hypothetical protein
MNTRSGGIGLVDDHARAARAYFDAHPEPKPWESAAVGDVWVLTIAGKEHAVTFRRGLAIHMNGACVELDKVTDGRRIYPEGD